jgi:hypothetical protein
VEDRLLPLKQTVRHPLDPRTTFHVHMGAGDGAVLAHVLLTTERHRMAQGDTKMTLDDT